MSTQCENWIGHHIMILDASALAKDNCMDFIIAGIIAIVLLGYLVYVIINSDKIE